MAEVLIIGAGPTGLMMACQLAIHKVPFRIIDKNEDHTTQSRAIVIHAASMEIFAQMGISDEFLKQGKQVKAINYIAKNKAIHLPLFSKFGKGLTPFPFFVALEQAKTEKILLDFLNKRGIAVDRNIELVSLSQTEERVEALLRHKDGREEPVTALWLVGADGASSTVRHELDIPFGGETYPSDLFVLDCKVSWKLNDDELYLNVANNSFAGFFPLPENRCRVISIVPKELSGKTDISFEDINATFAERMELDIKLYDPDWISTYRAHHRYVSQFKLGRCFLAGDAAHVHSPVGAQGMNTGLHDAYNLAWKLALVIKGKAKADLLSTYQDERLPFAKQLVKTTDSAFEIIINKNPLIKLIRTYVLPYILAFLVRLRSWTRWMFRTVSQVGITYSNSLLTVDASRGRFPSFSPKPGSRLPYVEFMDNAGKQVNTHSLVKEKMQLLLFNKPESNEENFLSVIKKYSEIEITRIPFTRGSEKLYKLLGLQKHGYYLVRPDLYIVYRCNDLSTDHFENFLKKFLYEG